MCNGLFGKYCCTFIFDRTKDTGASERTLHLPPLEINWLELQMANIILLAGNWGDLSNNAFIQVLILKISLTSPPISLDNNSFRLL